VIASRADVLFPSETSTRSDLEAWAVFAMADIIPASGPPCLVIIFVISLPIHPADPTRFSHRSGLPGLPCSGVHGQITAPGDSFRAALTGGSTEISS
jgi:hypothetical protein